MTVATTISADVQRLLRRVKSTRPIRTLRRAQARAPAAGGRPFVIPAE